MYKGKDCMKKEHAIEIINFEKERKLSLTCSKHKTCASQEYYNICRIKMKKEDANDTKYLKYRNQF